MGGDYESLGRAGEYFVAYLLEGRDVRVIRVDTSGHDLWCRVPSGRLLSVQVKTCSAPAPDRHGVPGYNFYDRGAYWRADVYAMVAFDIGLVLFEPGMGTRRRIRANRFTAAEMDAGVERFFR